MFYINKNKRKLNFEMGNMTLVSYMYRYRKLKDETNDKLMKNMKIRLDLLRSSKVGAKFRNVLHVVGLSSDV